MYSNSVTYVWDKIAQYYRRNGTYSTDTVNGIKGDDGSAETAGPGILSLHPNLN